MPLGNSLLGVVPCRSSPLVDYKSAIVYMAVLTDVRLWSFCFCPSVSIRKAKQQINKHLTPDLI